MILIDTHVVVWLALEPSRISKGAHGIISDARRDGSGLGIVDVSLWEIAMLVNRNRVKITISIESFLREIETNFIVFPLTSKIAARSMQFTERYPKDPTDRLIGATAVVEGLPLVTRDEKIRASKEVPTLW
ncbi:MAG TPA: type II toxin-antitoxin system VapC family toxin [Edaphobacter sp.]|nr:type II toxin-antitoxin system VapC family toxin [Edaphobacter sp.]